MKIILLLYRVFCSTKEKGVRIRGAGASAHPDFEEYKQKWKICHYLPNQNLVASGASK